MPKTHTCVLNQPPCFFCYSAWSLNKASTHQSGAGFTILLDTTHMTFYLIISICAVCRKRQSTIRCFPSCAVWLGIEHILELKNSRCIATGLQSQCASAIDSPSSTQIVIQNRVVIAQISVVINRLIGIDFGNLNAVGNIVLCRNVKGI